MTYLRPLFGLAALWLCACQSTAPAPMGPIPIRTTPPPRAIPGQCWAKDETPATFETVTEQVRLDPAGTGAGATYRTETHQRILRERRMLWFEIPCPARMDAGQVAALQRALKVRDVYSGPITGRMDGATRGAIRRYQALRGLDSGILSLAAARQLGIVAYGRDRP
ncbi:MAG: peptidoglycan-binding protein [Rhodobacteraceae bacterium]|nr:peptidoglycan-binding protein [Paracoccaceae bacterium]